jgi:hypothetical protein
MVIQRRLLLVVASALTLVLTVSAPMVAATREAKPSPLASGNLVRLKDVAANGNTSKGAIAAVGWHEASKPGQLWLAFSTDGGKTYRRSNGNLRNYRVVGDPALGMSLAICANRVWAASGYHSPSDRAGDSDVFLTTRTIGGGGAQALITSTSDDRRVRDLSIACAGSKYVAVGWLNKNGNGKTTARLMIRSVDPLGKAPAFKKIYNLGVAEFKSGLDVAATSNSVAMAFVRGGNLQLKRFDLDAAAGDVSPYPRATIAWKDVRFPQLAARSKRLVVAYSDNGKVRTKMSRDQGATFSKAKTIVSTGSLSNPSRAYSIDVAGDRMVATTGTWSKAAGKVTPQRLTSSTFGEKWSTRSFGNIGARKAVLMKKKNKDKLLIEGWHNNAPKGYADTLRARYEIK